MDDPDKIIKDLHIEAAQLLAQKYSDEAIVSALKKKGIDDHYAEIVLRNAKEDKSDKKEFFKHLFGGIFVLAAGVTLSIGTYFYTPPGGMLYDFEGGKGLG